jgi:hypothetical protein
MRAGSPLWAVAGLACGVRSRVRAGRSGLLGHSAAAGLFPFLKAFSNIVSSLICKFHIKLCRDPKIAKPIFLGSQNHALPVSIFGSYRPKIFQGRSKYSHMFKYY